MFTGLVEELGKVRSLSRGTHSIRLTIAAEKVLRDVKMGDSIAVDGACLTVVDFSAGSFTVDVMPETFDRTTLSMRKSGDTVNLERTLRVGDRLGGHIVSGPCPFRAGQTCVPSCSTGRPHRRHRGRPSPTIAVAWAASRRALSGHGVLGL